MEMRGTLFTYYAPDRLTAFESEPEDSPNTVVFIGGLGDGYMAVPYLSMLQSRLASMHWSLIQVQLSSSYTGYGISDLQTDCDELDRLVHFLRTKRNKQKIVFLGHSTGSQDCYWHNKHGTAAALVDGFVLQAPVSDREYYYKTHASSHERHLALAEEMRATGRGEELMPRGICPIPTTADRFYSLVAFGGDDDVFSSDLPDDRIQELYQGLERPMIWIHSKDDECYASEMDPMDLMRRFQSFCPAIKETHVLPSGGHSVETEESQRMLCDIVENFLSTL